MKKIGLVTPRCPVRTTLEMLGGKWRLLIIAQLNANDKRYSEIKRGIPEISEKMLIQELKTLVENDLITRKDHGEIPPKVSYSLTENGQHAFSLLEPISAFGMRFIT